MDNKITIESNAKVGDVYIGTDGLRFGKKFAVDINGNVGEIDGLKYKIAGAIKKKMDIILVPEANYEAAKKIVKENNYKVELVKVSTLQEAINYLTK